MQDNFFFREPETQKKLLDILFIYSKLNPDTGYRQGMHELLAPLLWVISQDSLDQSALAAIDKQQDGNDLMMDVLDQRFVEHDAFNLFCAVMQTAKSFYEAGDGKDSSPIVKMSMRIGDDLLSIFDPELAVHLQVAGVLPQIYAIRWIRLLFGREFEFNEVLRVWDILFAESLRTEIIDLTCVSMLLRVRWTLVEADYSTAITSLSRYSPPKKDEDPRALVRDAIYLDKNRSLEIGANLIQQQSGRKPKTQKRATDNSAARLRAEETPVRGSRPPQQRPSHSPSPARFNTPQKQLESIFQQVSGGIQQRTEGWNVSKAVRGAVGEVRRNMNNLQTSHSRNSSVDILSGGTETPSRSDLQQQSRVKVLEAQVQELVARNKALSKMLDGALDSLRSSKDIAKKGADDSEEAFNISLAKIQFVSVYLSDSAIPIPPEESDHPNEKGDDKSLEKAQDDEHTISQEKRNETTAASQASPTIKGATVPVKERKAAAQATSQLAPPSASVPVRPSLAESSFSFMLGENRHRSSFISSVAELPEQRRGSDAKPKPTNKQLLAEEKEAKDRKQRKERMGSESEDDGFTMNPLRGGQPQ